MTNLKPTNFIKCHLGMHRILFGLIIGSLLLAGCNIVFHNEKNYFKKSKEGLSNIIEIIKGKDKISLIMRRSYLGLIDKFLQSKSIDYKIESYETELEISFKLKDNFQEEVAEMKKKILNNKVESFFGIAEKHITLDSALSYIKLSKEDMINLFELMKEYKIIYVSRFRDVPSSFYFRIEDKFFIIYSENVSELNLEWQRQPTKLEDNWYYFDGDI